MSFIQNTKNAYQYAKWKVYDWKHPLPDHLKGVEVLCADTGVGKTVAMTYLAYMYADQYDAKIYSNYDIKGQAGSIKSVRDMVEVPHNSIICIDEINNVLNAQSWKDVDPAIFSLLTQHRHVWKKILATAQNFEEMHIGFRRHAETIIDVSNIGGRWFFLEAYKRSGFIQFKRLDEMTGREEFIEEWKRGKVIWKMNFIADNDLFNSYDTYQLVDFLTETKTDKEQLAEIHVKLEDGRTDEREQIQSAFPIRKDKDGNFVVSPTIPHGKKMWGR